MQRKVHQQNDTVLTPSSQLQQEMHLFLSLSAQCNQQAIAITIQDDRMQPHFDSGDCVGGYVVKQTDDLLGNTCLVKTSAKGDWQLGTLHKTSSGHMLSANNPKHASVVIKRLAEVARIVWHRKAC